MSAIATPLPKTPAAWKLPYSGKVGMACLIFAESAIFTIFVVAYLYYVGKSLSGPTPGEVLETPIFYTICLLSSSLTIHFAGKLLERGRRGAFLLFWLAGRVGPEQSARVDVLSLYWHFVDAVWVVVFTVVYVLGR